MYYIDYLYIYRCACTHSELFRELFSHTTLSDVYSLCIYMFSPMKWVHSYVCREQEHASCSQMCIILSLYVYTVISRL